jgi:glucans biosynthesis protein C
MRLYLAGIGSRPGFCDAGHCLILPTWNHLWFLPYLWLYTLALWGLLRWVPAALDVAGALASASLRGATLLLLAPVLWLAVTRLALGSRYPITHALVDDPLAHAQYAAAFALGAVLARAPAVWPRFEALRWPALALATLAWATAAWLGESLPPAFSVQQWCAIVAALGFAHRHLQRDHPARRWLTEAVFPVYVLHQTVILLLAHGLAPWALRPAVEGPLLIVGTFALCALGYVGVRRVALLRTWFGLAARGGAQVAARSGKIPA